MIVRIADIRTVGEWRHVYVNTVEFDHCIITTLDDRRIAVRERPEDIFTLITTALPQHRSIHDHVVMGRVDVPVTGSIEVAGAVEHVHIDRRETVS